MLNVEELKSYCDRHDLSPEARQVINLVRGSEPSRRVKSGRDNVACRFASRKMGVTIQAESHQNELPALVAWEHDDQTHEMYDQPPKVKLSFVGQNGKQCTHLATPDFFLLQEGFAGWVECKTEEWLQARAAEGSPKYVRDANGTWRCPPGEEYAASVGLGFRVRSSAATGWVMVRNLIFLSDYLDERCPDPEAEAVVSVREALDGKAWMPLKDLLDRLQTAADADTVYRMVADGLLYVRLEEDLLSEPELTLVFRDRLAADAYRIHLSSLAQPALSSIRKIVVAPGQSLLWDGKLWRILNVGDEDIFMEDEERVLTTLRREAFEQMVRTGVISGLPSGTVTDRDRADEVVRSASPGDFEHAMYRFKCLFPDQFEGEVPKSCSRARRKWRALFTRAQEMLGNGFLGLLPKIHLRGNRNRRLDQRVIEIMNEVIDEYFAKPGERTLVSCWGEARNRCKALGLVAPSEVAFRAEVKRRKQYALMVNRVGEKAAYAQSEFYWHIDRATPRHGERPFEIGHIDHTEIDLQFVGSRYGERLGKAWLSVLLDAHTRMVLAWVLLFDAPSYRSCMALIRDCIQRHGRIPKTIVVDKGSDFESVYFETLLARLESHKKTRPGSKPRFGSVIERFFGMSNDAFIHNLQGNNQALQKPRQLSKSHDPRDLAVWTLPEFRVAFEGFLTECYGAMEHSALGMSPKEAMAVGLAQSGLRRHVLISCTQDLTILCLPSTRKGKATVDSGRGIKINYIYYWSPAFRDPALHRASVPVRYDPFDASVAFAWVKDHWAPCQSEHASVFLGRSEKEIATATQELRARLKRTHTRRAINASMIASYLTSATVTEKTLSQRQRDLENQAGQSPLLMPDKSLGAGLLQAGEPSLWASLDLKIFGELQ